MSAINSYYPRHLSIIMDGNSRWARVRGLDEIKGHSKGAERVREIVKFCAKSGTGFLSLFAFSAENWQRPAKEVNAIMELLVSFLKKELSELNRNKVKFIAAGRREKFSGRVLSAVEKAEEKTAANSGLRLILCLDYGGRQEIVDGVNKICKTPVTEEEFGKYLYLPQVPDVDLLIRTSGEERISNYFLWQTAYTEFYFTDTLWPDFTTEELGRAIKSFARRQRRYGRRI